MKFTFKAKSKEEIEHTANECLEAINDNMLRGIRETELFIDKNIFYEVIDIINRETEGQNFGFKTIKKGINPLTGKVSNCWAEVTSSGLEKRVILKYYGN